MLSLPVIVLLVFLGIVTFVVAAAMVVRDLMVPGDAHGGVSLRPRPIRIRRALDVFDQAPARSLLGRIDQGFDRLVLEATDALSPISAALLMIAIGLAVGGGVWIAFDLPLAGLAAGMVGMFAPLLALMRMRSQRIHAIRTQLPGVLDMFARAVRAGESVDQAIKLIGEEAGGVLGREFQRCSRQLELGRSFTSVMKHLAARIRLVEFRILTTTLIVQRQAGGSLPDTLERMGAVIRDRTTAWRQIRAATGAGRASALLIAAVCPIAYVSLMILQPEHLAVLYSDPLGRSMFVVAVVLELIGMLWIMALLRPEN